MRSYEDRTLPAELLEEILEAGTYAPSAVNYQPWYFVAVQSQEAMEKLTGIMGRVSRKIEPSLQERFPTHPEVVAETTGFIRRLGNAPVCILAFALKPDYPKTAETIAQSVAAGIENMLLAATAEGLGSVVHIPVKKEPEQIAALIQPKKDYQLPALVMLGHPAPDAEVPAQVEATVAKNVHWNEW